MHIFTHLKPESVGVTGLGIEADGMVEHDGHVGQLLQKLDDLGIADNTIVLYLTDNGAQIFSWPDGGMAPFKGEKNSNWEGAYRVPMMARWPSQIAPGTISNDIFSLQDWLPTLLAAAGDPDVKDQLLGGYQAGDTTFSVHLDGYNQLGHLTNGAPGERHEFYYFNDDGEITGLREDRWKFVMMEQPAEGLDVWFEPFDDLRTPRIVDLRGDPFERALTEGANYDTWLLERLFLLYPIREQLQEFYATFAQFPPRQSAQAIGRITQLIDYLEQIAP